VDEIGKVKSRGRKGTLNRGKEAKRETTPFINWEKEGNHGVFGQPSYCQQNLPERQVEAGKGVCVESQSRTILTKGKSEVCGGGKPITKATSPLGQTREKKRGHRAWKVKRSIGNRGE